MISGVIVGNLGRDAETFETGNAKGCRFSVACKQGWGDKEETVWVSVTYFGARGVSLCNHLRKGSFVQVVGEFTLSEYQNKENHKVTALRCVADRIKLLGGKKNAGSHSEGSSAGSYESSASDSLGGDVSFEDDDIPF